MRQVAMILGAALLAMPAEATSAKARLLERIQSIQSELRALRPDVEALP